MTGGSRRSNAGAPAPRHGRDAAYRLAGRESHRRYYDDWAETYDSGFARESGYVYPKTVGRKFLELSAPADTPVAELGCGTGLAGLALSGSKLALDGFDLSAGMLREAAAKGVYRNLRMADLTRQEGLPHAQYGGLISCGTFTLGHLGPDDLRTSLVMARRGALCVIGINAQHFDDEEFGPALTRLEQHGRIAEFSIEDVPIYRDGDELDLVNIARLAIFRVVE